MSTSLRGLYLLVDPEVLGPEHWSTVLPEVIAQPWALIQLRAKVGDKAAQLRWAKNLASICHEYDRQLLINDRVDLALECAAQGVHLGQSDGEPEHARRLLGPGALIGRTAHADMALVQAAAEAGADYVSVGALFRSGTKPQARPASLQVLREAVALSSVPVCAIGGIDAQTLAAVQACQPALIAVCGAVLRGANPAHQAAHLMRSFQDD